MRKALNLAVTLTLLVVISMVVWLVWQPAPPEPVFQGQPLSYWLVALGPRSTAPANPNVPSPPTTQQAEAAIRGMGITALPALLRMLEEPDYGLKDKVAVLLQRYHVTRSGRLFMREPNFAALNGFRALGPAVSNALPQLITIFDQNHSAFPQQAVPAIIAQAGPAAQPAIPSLLRGATHTNLLVRNNSIYALGCIHAEPGIVVPALIKALNDPEGLVRMQAASALKKFGTNAESAVPALLALYHRESAATNSEPTGNIGTAVAGNWARPGIIAANVLGASWDALEAIDPAAGEAAASGK